MTNPKPAQAAVAHDAAGEAITVLIVDDHAVFADALQLWLDGRDGLRVIGVARNGSEAVELALLLGPDVVLMDLGLPKLDGIEATRQLQALDPTARVIALTGSADEETRRRAFEAGAVDYLLKGDVEERVHAAIRAATAPQRLRSAGVAQ